MTPAAGEGPVTLQLARRFLGGIAAVIGSFATWGACPLEDCASDFGLTVLDERSGIEFGVGVGSAAFGIILVVIGIFAIWNQHRLVPLIGAIAAGGILSAVGIYLIMVGGGDITTGSPGLGLYLTAIGGALSLTGNIRLAYLQRRQISNR